MADLARKWRNKPFVNGVPTPPNRIASHRECKACDNCGSVTILGGDLLRQNKKYNRFFCDIQCAGEYKRWHNQTEDYQEKSGIAAYRKQALERLEEKRKLHQGWKCCLECGNAFHGGGKWCSHDCSYKISRRVGKRLRVFNCAACGKVFSRMTKSLSRKYCSSLCSARAARATARIKRRHSERRGDNPGLTWLYVAKRDNWRCNGCGCRCSRPKGDNAHNEATLDHILPLSKGGEHSAANVQLLCRRCNSNKSDSLLYGQMRLFG